MDRLIKMKLVEIKENKKAYLPLLLLADEQESMIDRYLERGKMYAVLDSEVLAVAVVTDEGQRTLEIKNIAVSPKAQGKGLGRRMIEEIVHLYRGQYETLIVGTGDSPLTIPFYEKCGFEKFAVVPDFFTEHYDHPIYEDGKQLTDMVYLKRKL